MHPIKSFILALASSTAAVALPYEHCSQDVADLTKAKEFQNQMGTSHFSNLTIDGHLPPSDPEDVQEQSLFPRELSDEISKYHDWIHRTSPWRHRKDFRESLRRDFDEVVKSHLPEGIVLPEPLLPTSDEKLLDVYRKAAAEVALEDMKTTELKNSEIAQLKYLAVNFWFASICWWDRECAQYEGRWGKRADRIGGWKQAVYDPLREELKKKTTSMALLHLGKRLQAETNFKIPYYAERSGY
jgi:hypothetical protein